jgi:2-desacetyl-2-hydroxyethyl bacteriochlorophyllide A dehydrogenase
LKTLQLTEPGRFEMMDRPPIAALQEGEALVRVLKVGICGTDLHAFAGNQPFFTYPRVLGHELAVEVVKITGDTHGLKLGDRCAVEPYLDCGECQACRRGKTNCCENIKVLGVHTDGGMTEFIRVPTDKLHPSNRLKDEQLALVETLAIGGHAVFRATISSEDQVLIIGTGPIGLSVVEFVRISGARFVVADREEHRLQFCRERLKVVNTLRTDNDFDSNLVRMLDGNRPTVVFDATGNSASMMKSFDYCAHGGKLVFVGLFQGDVTFNDPSFHKKELTLMASRNATSPTFRSIINHIENGRMDTSPWVTHTLALEDLPEQFSSLLDPESRVIKAMVSISSITESA